MKKIDLYWQSNDDWWEVRNCIPVVKDDAPPEAKKSYERCLEQTTDETISPDDVNGGLKSENT